jgi:hypothetical protein
MSQLRKAMIALLTIASIGVVAPQAASARGGFGGHSFGGGAFHGGYGGYHGGGFHGGGYHGFHHGYGFAPGFALGFGLYAPYYGYPYYGDPYVGYDEGYYGGDCMIIHHRVHTRHGWRYRTEQVCE